MYARIFGRLAWPTALSHHCDSGLAVLKGDEQDSDCDNIDRTVLELFNLARRFDGDYDGLSAERSSPLSADRQLANRLVEDQRKS